MVNSKGWTVSRYFHSSQEKLIDGSYGMMKQNKDKSIKF